MAVVYLAHDRKHDRPVAIKVVRPEVAYGLGTDRFLREVQIAARLQHPLILAVIDSGQTEETEPRPYYVMPYVEGETLRERLTRDGPLPPEAALPLIKEIGEALDYAHREGVIHRDVKPENVLLFRGHALVADFGIARGARVAGDARLTETGTSLGTPAYMSPEQAGGTGEVDARSDQYSLSCVCYELLCGQPPFTGATAAAIMAAKLTEPVTSLANRQPGLPAGLTTAVHRALAKSPAERFESVASFIAALEVSGASAGAPARSLVVLPFSNLSPDPENEYFGDGLTEELIADLSKVSELKVIARNSAMRLKGTTKDARTLGRELNVRYVLGGSVRKAGPNLRITAQLSDATDDSQVWAEKYSGTMDDVFELQETLSRQIVAALKLTLKGDEQRALGERPIKNPVAYEMYLKARRELDKTNRPAIDRAVALLEQAEAIEGPNLALMHAFVTAYGSYRNMGWETVFDPMSMMDQVLARMRRIDAASVETEGSQAVIEYWLEDYVAVARRAHRVLAKAPTLPDALLYWGSAMQIVGQVDRARPAVIRLHELDPLSWASTVLVEFDALAAGRYADAVATVEAGLRYEPENFDLAVHRAWCLTYCGFADRASDSYHRLAEAATAWSAGTAYWCRACASGAVGDREGVLAATTPSMRAFLARAHPLWILPLIEAHAVAGLADAAMEWIETLCSRGYADYPYLTHDPLLANLHGFARFEQFLPVAKAKWEAVARQLEDLPPL